MSEEIRPADTEVVEAGPVRPLPEPVASRALVPAGISTTALAVAGGAVAGVATVTFLRAARRAARPRGRRLSRRGKQKIVASRSFLVDVHVLGK